MTDHLLVDQMRHEADGGEACGFVVTPEALLELQHETLEHEFTDLRKLHKNHKENFSLFTNTVHDVDDG